MPQSETLREIPVNEEMIFSGRLIRVSHMQVRLPDGRIAFREIVRHHGGAAIVPVDSQGQVTLVRQYRAPLDAVTLEIPAGKLDSADENPLCAAKRELEEETGLHAQRMDLLTVMLPTPGYCDERVHIFLATELSQHRLHPDADEFLTLMRIPLSQAAALVVKGEIVDSKTALGILLAGDRLRHKTQTFP